MCERVCGAQKSTLIVFISECKFFRLVTILKSITVFPHIRRVGIIFFLLSFIQRLQYINVAL